MNKQERKAIKTALITLQALNARKSTIEKELIVGAGDNVIGKLLQDLGCDNILREYDEFVGTYDWINKKNPL